MRVGKERFYKGRDGGHRGYSFSNARHSIWLVSVTPFLVNSHTMRFIVYLMLLLHNLLCITAQRDLVGLYYAAEDIK